MKRLLQGIFGLLLEQKELDLYVGQMLPWFHIIHAKHTHLVCGRLEVSLAHWLRIRP